jgi:hypothetical protein
MGQKGQDCTRLNRGPKRGPLAGRAGSTRPYVSRLARFRDNWPVECGLARLNGMVPLKRQENWYSFWANATDI